MSIDDTVEDDEATVEEMTSPSSASRVSHVETPSSKPVEEMGSNEPMIEAGNETGEVVKIEPETSPGRCRCRKRRQVERLDPSHAGKSYDNAMVQMMCMSKIADKKSPKRLSLNRGLRVWGEKGMAAVKAELSQIHYRDVFTPVDPDKLTWKQKSEALESHMFLEEKRNLDKKGRIVAGGNKQREYTSK